MDQPDFRVSDMSEPFGIQIHASLDEAAVIESLGDSKFRIAPPKPHPTFSTYFAEDRPGFGVVWLKGLSSELSADTYGNATRQLLERISGQLETRYGAPRKVNLLHADSIWNEPRDWMASLHQNERSFFHIWEKGKSNPPEDIDTVFLGVLAHNHHDASVIIEYASSRHADAEQHADDDLANLL